MTQRVVFYGFDARDDLYEVRSAGEAVREETVAHYADLFPETIYFAEVIDLIQLPRDRWLIEYSEFGGVLHVVPVDEFYDRILPRAEESGWRYEIDKDGVDATHLVGNTYHRYELYPRTN